MINKTAHRPLCWVPAMAPPNTDKQKTAVQVSISNSGETQPRIKVEWVGKQIFASTTFYHVKVLFQPAWNTKLCHWFVLNIKMPRRPWVRCCSRWLPTASYVAKVSGCQIEFNFQLIILSEAETTRLLGAELKTENLNISNIYSRLRSSPSSQRAQILFQWLYLNLGLTEIAWNLESPKLRALSLREVEIFGRNWNPIH